MATRSFVFVLVIMAASAPALAAAPPNDRVNRATSVSALPFEEVLDTTTATTAFNDPSCVGQGPTVWFKYRASHDGTIAANTFGSGYDTTLSVYTYTPGRVLAQLACNDDYDGLQSYVSFHVTAGVTYYVMVGAYGSGAGGHLAFAIDQSEDRRDVELGATISAGVLDASTGLVTLRGTVTCSRPQFGFISGQVTQKRSGGAVRAFFSTEIFCDRSGTWTAVSTRPQPTSGRAPTAALFSRGGAVVSARGAMWDQETGELSELSLVTRVRF